MAPASWIQKCRSCFFFSLVLATSCYRTPEQLEPRLSCIARQEYFSKLHSPFTPLDEEESSSAWGKEMFIARAFSQELDLYRAVSTYKRAAILIPDSFEARKLEIQYQILLCYFLGERYDETIETFEKSSLAHVDKTFPAYHDLLLILYECCEEINCLEKRERIYELIQESFLETGEKLRVSRALRKGDLCEIQEINNSLPHPSYLDCLLDEYECGKKSVRKAKVLNAMLPGAGYFYIGQRKSAVTAFLINGLFIAAAYQFFHRGNIAAGIITTGFESGWYFGGIYGAGEEAKYFNERVYEKAANSALHEYQLFPCLMLQYSF